MKNKYITSSELSENIVTIEHTLSESWIAGIIGSMEIKIGKTTAIVTILPSDIYEASAIKKLSRSGNSTERITKDRLIELFQAYSGGLFPREVIPDIFVEITKGKESISRIVPKYILKITDDEIIQIVRQAERESALTISDTERKIEFLTGCVKEKLKNRVSGKRIVNLLRGYINR